MTYQQARHIILKAAAKEGVVMPAAVRSRVRQDFLAVIKNISKMQGEIKRGVNVAQTPGPGGAFNRLDTLYDIMKANQYPRESLMKVSEAKKYLWTVLNVNPAVRPDLKKRSWRIMHSALGKAKTELKSAYNLLLTGRG